MTEYRRQQALEFFREEADSCRRAPEINGCPMTPEWQRILDACLTAIEALEATKTDGPYSEP